MSPAVSLYLDVLRLVAALLVLLSHLGHGHLVGGSLWRFTRVGNEAVMLFFVLSGFVIAFVADRREHSLRDYAASRLSRLYSVIVPALMLTVVLDGVSSVWGVRVAEGGVAREGQPAGAVGYLLSLTMLSQSWGLHADPGSNAAYWSVPYEFWYYALFGAWCFLRGTARWFAVTAAALLAGPQVLALLPVWMCGVAAYQWQRRRGSAVGGHPGALAMNLLSGAAALAMLGLAALQPPGLKNADWFSGSWPWQFAFAALVACHLATMSSFRVPASVSHSRWAGAIRFGAGCSFSLYLMHLPVLHLLQTLRLPAGTTRSLLMIGLPLLIACTLGRWCEQKKTALKRLLLSASTTGSAAIGPRGR